MDSLSNIRRKSKVQVPNKKRCFAFGCSYTNWIYPTFDTEATKNALKFFNSLYADEERLKTTGSTHDEFKQWTYYKSNYRKESKILG